MESRSVQYLGLVGRPNLGAQKTSMESRSVQYPYLVGRPKIRQAQYSRPVWPKTALSEGVLPSLAPLAFGRVPVSGASAEKMSVCTHCRVCGQNTSQPDLYTEIRASATAHAPAATPITRASWTPCVTGRPARRSARGRGRHSSGITRAVRLTRAVPHAGGPDAKHTPRPRTTGPHPPASTQSEHLSASQQRDTALAVAIISEHSLGPNEAIKRMEKRARAAHASRHSAPVCKAGKPAQRPQHHDVCNTDNAADAKRPALTYQSSQTPQPDTVYAHAPATAHTPPLHEVEDATGGLGDTQQPQHTRPDQVSSDGAHSQKRREHAMESTRTRSHWERRDRKHRATIAKDGARCVGDQKRVKAQTGLRRYQVSYSHRMTPTSERTAPRR